MTTCLTILYERPADAEAFVRRYREEHVPVANGVLGSHGLRRWTLEQPVDALDNDPAKLALIATLWFDASTEEVMAALASEEGQRLYQHALSLTDAPMQSYLSRSDEMTV